MDTVDRSTRSKIMASVRQKSTGPEMRLRRALHKIGFRYRVNDNNLPGSPDLVFPKYKAVIFVHGCFWHRHGCKATTTPKTRREFWKAKFNANIERDRSNTEALLNKGWRVMVVWECSLKGKKANLDYVAQKVRDWLCSGLSFSEYSY